MRILFGVQGTGNGHVTRARQLVSALISRGLSVEVLLSGRGLNQWPDEPWIDNAHRYSGLTFVTRNGRVDRWRTLSTLRPFRTVKEMNAIPADDYDLVISDFEPLSAWSARRLKVPCIGIGHQYAFCHRVPSPHDDLIGALVLRHFAPASTYMGLHWHPFGAPILPPMIDHSLVRETPQGYTLVYRPFEDTRTTISLLRQFPNHKFQLFAPDAPADGVLIRNVWVRPVSAGLFRESLLKADRVVCSTGFMLISESLHLGLPILTRPVQGQYEQRANAAALSVLDVGTVCEAPLSKSDLSAFLDGPVYMSPVRFPDVASAIADEIERLDVAEIRDGSLTMDMGILSQRLWRDVQTSQPAWASVAVEADSGIAEPAMSRFGIAA
ncbi:MAG: hypothetical protein KTR32_32440 [Granulosicoccus sp.]|nr:hypothetical protein [Granulosicoccus sp.]